MNNFLSTYENSSKNIKAVLNHNYSKNINNRDVIIQFDNASLRELYEEINDDSIFLITLARLIQEWNVAYKNPTKWSIKNLSITNLLKSLNWWSNINNIEFDLNSTWEIQVLELKDIDVDSFPQMSSLSELPWNTVIPWWIWWGSDVVQAWQLAQLLRLQWKKVPFVYSVRTEITWSQWPTWAQWESRVPENSKEVSPWVYKITPESKMKGRALEPAVSQFIPVYLILITEWIELTSQIEFLNKLLPEWTDSSDTTFLQCDTWWDCLYPFDSDWIEEAKQTPDQDLTVLAGFSEANLQWANKISSILATWVDTPHNAEEVLKKAESKFYQFNPTEWSHILQSYTDIEMRWRKRNPDLYGKTPSALMAYLEWGEWFVSFDQIPKWNITSKTNPWFFIWKMQKSIGWVFFQNLDKHLPAIGYEKN